MANWKEEYNEIISDIIRNIEEAPIFDKQGLPLASRRSLKLAKYKLNDLIERIEAHGD